MYIINEYISNIINVYIDIYTTMASLIYIRVYCLNISENNYYIIFII